MQKVEALIVATGTDQPVEKIPLGDYLEPENLEHESTGSLIVLPGFGSRKRVADTLGRLPEQVARFFDGNLVILHFDK